MTILLNGEKIETEVRTVAELLREVGAAAHGIAVAVNGNVIRREEHATTAVVDGAEIEIIRAVQGG
ncbi:MAG TPA: sulfur carrier protein ThiS [Abditibacteriaceae bacterium]|nr:sulfur carrier protein ThiS [Abditibacteriaceae bacterium]